MGSKEPIISIREQKPDRERYKKILNNILDNKKEFFLVVVVKEGDTAATHIMSDMRGDFLFESTLLMIEKVQRIQRELFIRVLKGEHKDDKFK